MITLAHTVYFLDCSSNGDASTEIQPTNLFLSTAESKMGYENHVYLAKLAEQAERYEGIEAFASFSWVSANPKHDFRNG